jgi:excisionase family DNA binding protein
MTVRDLAQYLKISVTKVYRLANNSQIPAFRIGSSWRFKQDMIDAWIEQGCRPPVDEPRGRLRG